MRSALPWVAALLTSACEPKIPENIFVCDQTTECPGEQVCDMSKKFCVDPSSITGDDGGGPPVVVPSVPPSGSFATVGGRRSNGSITVYDDGFEKGQRVCTADRALCVTGGFEP